MKQKIPTPSNLQKLASEEPIMSINCGILDVDTIIENITDTSIRQYDMYTSFLEGIETFLKRGTIK